MDRATTETKLINGYQHEFPLVPRPFQRIGESLGMDEDEVLALLQDLQDRGALARIGAVVSPRTIGTSTLAAMTVPPDRLEDVAALVSAFPEVNHNYEREHDINLWFVVAAPSENDVATVLHNIERRTGLEVIGLPMLDSYHIDLGFRLPCG